MSQAWWHSSVIGATGKFQYLEDWNIEFGSMRPAWTT